MPSIITNTSPLYYLHQLDALPWLPELFTEISTPTAVVTELHQGREKGHNAPDPEDYPWIKIKNPSNIPPEWLALDLGAGELAVLALSLEETAQIILLDERIARRIAEAAGLTVWGTLRVLLEAKSKGLTSQISPHIDRLKQSGMWITDPIRQRILSMAGESV